MQITYLSHGQYESGGYHHESLLAKTLGECKEIRFRKNYRGILGWIALFFRAFSNATGDVVLTVSRLAWPVYLRNIFNKKKIIVVLHNYDRTDNKPKLYYTLLDAFLRFARKRKGKVAIVVVAQYWKDFFSKKFGLSDNIFVFPNFMDNAKLQFFKEVAGKKSDLIHLGQWSDKIDKKAYMNLIHGLKEKGFTCYFSDNTGAKIQDFPVSYFNSYEAYLKQMAMAKYTVILNSVNEGWNRVAHESFMVGTLVIANKKGGLTELVSIGNGFLVDGETEAQDIIVADTGHVINYEALKAYDISNSDINSIPIKSWLTNIE